MQAQFLKDSIMMMVVWFGVAFPCENELHLKRAEIIFFNRTNVSVN